MKGQAIGLGAQENLCGAVAKDGRMFNTQYVGDGDSMRVIDFLESAVEHFRKLLGVDRPQAVAVDLHPGYTNRKLGKKLALREGAELVEVQHHWAHAAALLVESGEEEMVALTLDGTGYGTDGQAWGGCCARTSPPSTIAHPAAIPFWEVKAVRDLEAGFRPGRDGGQAGEYFNDAEAACGR